MRIPDPIGTGAHSGHIMLADLAPTMSPNLHVERQRAQFRGRSTSIIEPVLAIHRLI